MNNHFPPHWNFSTPPTIRRLILWTSIVAILSALFQPFFDSFDIWPGPQYLLSLSWTGLKSGYFWQPLSYLFVQYAFPHGLSFFFLVTLFLNMYLLWIVGTPLLNMLGKATFLKLYFVSGLISGLCAVSILSLVAQEHLLAGSTSAILTLLTTWSMAFPETQILLFFLIPIRAKSIVAFILGGILLITLAREDIGYLVLYIVSIMIGYIYSTSIKGWYSPFNTTRELDLWFIQLGGKFRYYAPQWLKNKIKPSKRTSDRATIIEFPQAPQNDEEAFVDAMLAKISKYGENSLSTHERRKLNEISSKKIQEKQNKRK